MCYSGLCKFEDHMGDCTYRWSVDQDQRALHDALGVTCCLIGELINASARTTYEEALLTALTTAKAADAPTVLIDLRGP